MSLIHPTAIIDPTAKIGIDVEIGAYSIIGADVEIGDETWIGPHVVIKGPTTIGKQNKIYQFSSIGEDPQDKKYAGEATRLEIGDRNLIREFCTFNRGTAQDRGVTTVGDDNWIMAYVHLAHDCVIGNNTILANNAGLAGHVHIDDYAILGGYTVAHQFCSFGKHSITAMGTIVFKDVPPYLTVSGYPAKPHGLNSEGLKRRGFSPEALRGIKQAYKILYRSALPLKEAVLQLEALAKEVPEVAEFCNFIKQNEAQGRGIVR
ncbi:MAG: acyl-ACP--UDP-N-acetylglucosamine O-acyltransferase [Gammaproteobacteria bacterium]|nr:acyl-ACP--UDP-N-acetylglucosamine O-acyltransferase [Gammaproteobacteria bacterium]